MIKLTGGLIGLLIVYIVWMKRQGEATSRLREIDEGRRCIACDGTQLQREGGVARCLRCGHKVNLAAMQAAQVSQSEIADVTRPDDRRL